MLEARNWAMHKITSIPMLILKSGSNNNTFPDKLRGVNYFQPNETGNMKELFGANKERIDKLSR